MSVQEGYEVTSNDEAIIMVVVTYIVPSPSSLSMELTTSSRKQSFLSIHHHDLLPPTTAAIRQLLVDSGRLAPCPLQSSGRSRLRLSPPLPSSSGWLLLIQPRVVLIRQATEPPPTHAPSLPLPLDSGGHRVFLSLLPMHDTGLVGLEL